MTGATRESDADGRLHVAMDAAFRTWPPSGIRTYGEMLVRALEGLDDAPEVTSVSPMQVLRVPRRVGRMLWETVGVELTRRRQLPGADLLHVPAFSAPLRCGVPLVVTVHDTIPLALPEYRRSAWVRGYLALHARTVRRAAMVLTPSEAAADDIRRLLRVPEHRLRVVPLAPDPGLAPAAPGADLGAPLARLGISRPYLLSIAGFDARKNLPLLVRAFARALPMLDAHVQLVIAGERHSDNPMVFPPVAPVIAAEGIEHRVVLTGRVSDGDRRVLYQGAMACVTPSVAEGFGLTVVEAMACGVPVIAADRGAVPEVAGGAALLVEPTANDVAEAIVAVTNDAALRERLAAAGLERVKVFSWERTARLTMDAYGDALG